MEIDRSTEVKPVADERVLLDDSLRPLWMFIRYNGILPNFLDQENRNCLFYIFRLLFTSSIVLTILMYTAFELFQLVTEIPKTNQIFNFVYVFSFLLVGLNSLSCQIQTFMHHKEFLQFFKDWKIFEMQSLEHFHGIKKTKTINMLYFVFGSLLVQIIIGSLLFNYMEPNSVCFFSYYSSLRKVVNVHFLCLVTSVFSYFANVYIFLAEIIPTLFFYHAGCIVEDLERELKYISEEVYSRILNVKHRASVNNSAPLISNLSIQFKGVRSVRNVWEKYETVFDWVSKGNELFGSLILISYFMIFTLCVISSYMTLDTYKTSPRLSLCFFIIFLLSTSRTLLMNRLMSHLVSSGDNLKSTTALILTRKWDKIPEKDRHVLVTFQARLNNEKIAASPFHLFTVHPSNILSMMSLIVTYIIVLLQFET